MPVSDGTIYESHIAGNSINNEHIGPLAVTAAELDTDAVTTAKIAPLAVGTAEIAFLAVGTEEIASQAVKVEQQLNPVHGDTLHAEATATLTTSNAALATGTFTIPSWVGELHIFSTHTLYSTASESLTQWVYFESRLGGVAGNGAYQDLTAGDSETSSIGGRATITAPGTSIEVATWGKVETTGQDAYVDAQAIILGLR